MTDNIDHINYFSENSMLDELYFSCLSRNIHVVRYLIYRYTSVMATVPYIAMYALYGAIESGNEEIINCIKQRLLDYSLVWKKYVPAAFKSKNLNVVMMVINNCNKKELLYPKYLQYLGYSTIEIINYVLNELQIYTATNLFEFCSREKILYHACTDANIEVIEFIKLPEMCKALIQSR